MKYKIQVQSVNGWADLKVSEDGGPCAAELFGTIKEAREDLPEDGRVVPEYTPAQDDLY